jgi:hypothetical protein
MGVPASWVAGEAGGRQAVAGEGRPTMGWPQVGWPRRGWLIRWAFGKSGWWASGAAGTRGGRELVPGEAAGVRRVVGEGGWQWGWLRVGGW